MNNVWIPLSLVISMGCASTVATVPPPSPAARVVGLAAQTGSPTVVFDHPTLKVVAIRLPPGATMPEHDAAATVTIQALEGSGIVVAGERFPIDPTHAVVLAPRVPHSVDAGDEGVLLLVHHARSQ